MWACCLQATVIKGFAELLLRDPFHSNGSAASAPGLEATENFIEAARGPSDLAASPAMAGDTGSGCC